MCSSTSCRERLAQLRELYAAQSLHEGNSNLMKTSPKSDKSSRRSDSTSHSYLSDNRLVFK